MLKKFEEWWKDNCLLVLSVTCAVTGYYVGCKYTEYCIANGMKKIIENPNEYSYILDPLVNTINANKKIEG